MEKVSSFKFENNMAMQTDRQTDRRSVVADVQVAADTGIISLVVK